MSGILLLNNYFTYVDFVSALVTFVVAVFLAKLQVPCADSRWTPFNRMRWLMVGAYTALGVSNIMSALQPHEVETDILKAAVLIVGMVQALLFTAMCITFINPQKVSIRWGLYNCLAIGCAAALIVAGHSVGEWEFTAAVNISTALYIAELVVFSWKFFHTYTESKQCLESNYDEDLSSRLRWIKWCFISALGVGVIALLIVFQPELRRALEKIGHTWFGISSLSADDPSKTAHAVAEICKACKTLSETHTGALIVIERETKLNDLIHAGIALDSLVSAELLLNIFVVNTPLHDGAVIVRNDRIMAATCVLPLTKREDLSSELGTRHRAGIGMSEQADAVTVIVSEETGTISYTVNGHIYRRQTAESLEANLLRLLENDSSKKTVNPKKFLYKKGASK